MKPKLNVDLQQSGPKVKVSTPRLRRYLYELNGLTYTFETFADLGAWLTRLASDKTNSALAAKTQRDTRYYEGYAQGLREAAEIAANLKLNPDFVFDELTDDERHALRMWREGDAVVLSKEPTIGEVLKLD
jgi:hypothetical protein